MKFLFELKPEELEKMIDFIWAMMGGEVIGQEEARIGFRSMLQSVVEEIQVEEKSETVEEDDEDGNDEE